MTSWGDVDAQIKVIEREVRKLKVIVAKLG
jgi:hypothetical protein